MYITVRKRDGGTLAVYGKRDASRKLCYVIKYEQPIRIVKCTANLAKWARKQGHKLVQEGA